MLCDAVLSLLAPPAGGTIVDATAGHGGHSRLLAQKVGPGGRLVALDVDPANLDRTRAAIESLPSSERPTAHFLRVNFRELQAALTGLGVGPVDILLADLGVSTDQLLDGGRGLSFAEDAPLDMRLDDREERSAADLVNSLGEQDLADLIYHLSQERFSRRIAKRICQMRREGRIRRTSELVHAICSALNVSAHSRPGKLHPATRTFLALRMAVNRELENLQSLLAQAPQVLRPGGRIGVISFHSGEDRGVKQDFLDRQRAGVYEIVTKKPVQASREEIDRNPRARSAKLRVAIRTRTVGGEGLEPDAGLPKKGSKPVAVRPGMPT